MKNNNNLKIFLIILLSIMALAITIFMILAVKNNFKFLTLYNDEEKIILEKEFAKEDFERIKIEAITSDISIKQSNNDEVKVIITGNRKDTVKDEIINNILNIQKQSTESFCIGFCRFNNDEIIIYIPRDIEKAIDIKITSGDVEIENFDKLDVDIKTTSGDIELGNIHNTNIESKSGEVKISKAALANIKTISGDITIQEIEKRLDTQTTSGDIKINNLISDSDSNIKTTSGDISIYNINDIYIDAKTISGDIQIKNNNRYASSTLKIETTSGDIIVK